MTTMVKTAQDCIDAFKALEAKHGKTPTRDRYRSESGIPESVWEYHFGTYAELKRQAGAAPKAAVTKLHTAVAKVTAAKATYEAINKDRHTYGETYLRPTDGRYKTILVASDLHDKEIDPFFLRVFLDTAERVQPDVVSLGGDVFDLPEFGRYTVDPREWDAVGRIKFTHNNIFRPLRAAVPNAQIDLIEGNHECVTPDTEILTHTGWVRAGHFASLGVKPLVASFDPVTHAVQYAPAVAVATQDNRDLYEVESLYKKERTTDNHRYLYDGKFVHYSDLPKELAGEKFTHAINFNPSEEHRLDIDPNIVRLAVWIITHGSIMRTENKEKYYLLFNKVGSRIARRIQGVVQKIKGIDWEKIPGGVEVSGPGMAVMIETITGMEDIDHGTRWFSLPDWFASLGSEYGKIVAHELTWATTTALGTSKTTFFTGWRHNLGQEIQLFLALRGVPCNYVAHDNGRYKLVFNETNEMEFLRGKRVKTKALGKGSVVSVQTQDGTLITRLDGKINFTGNCRLVKHLADFSPATRAILGDLHGMTIGDLFGLREFEINYVAKADLKSYTAREHAKELENNYRVYYDAFMVHHFPHARHMGLPGVNGHHHQHISFPMFNVHRGAYEWHQLGAGHKRSASYCEGERWHNGFALAHIDTLTKQVNIEYIPITDFAVVGGKFYSREKHEEVTPLILGG